MYLSGKFLFVAGNALYNRLNQPAKRLPYSLAPLVSRLDIVGYRNFYGGAPARPFRRLLTGLRNIAVDRVQIRADNSTREIALRKIHMPQPLEMTLQARWLLQILERHLEPVYDAAIVSGPENCHLAERLLASGMVERIVYYDTDHFPSYVDPRWAKIAVRQEKRMIELASGIVCVSRPLAELRRQQGARAVTVINNGVSVEIFRGVRDARFQHALTLIYAGTLDRRWGIDIAIEAMPAILARVPEARLIIAGDGPDESLLRQMVGERQIAGSVTFTGRVSYETLPELFAQADIGLATSRPGAFRLYASPMKVADYLAGGLAIIYSGGGDGERLVAESGAGICIEANAESIAQTALKLNAEPEQVAQMSKRALRFAETLSWEHCAERLSQFLGQMLKAAPAVVSRPEPMQQQRRST